MIQGRARKNAAGPARFGSGRRHAAHKRFATLAVLVALAALATDLAVSPAAAAADGVREALRQEAELLATTGRTSYGELEISAPALLAELYARRDYAPFWDSRERRAQVVTAVRASTEDGLDPAHYHLARITRTLATEARGRELTARGSAAFDLLLSDAVVRLARDLRYGSTRRQERGETDQDVRTGPEPDEVDSISRLLAAASVPSSIMEWLPRSRHYLRLRAALGRYRGIALDGGWPAVPAGPTMRPGSRDARVAALAARLTASGDLAAAADDARSYGPDLEAAVRRFQRRHGIAVDGEVGGATLRALNVPVEARIDQLRVNLERERLDGDGRDADLLRVNIPAFRADFVRDGRTVWSTRVIVGEAGAATPLIDSEIRYVVLNPTWTVPYGIASRELLPRIQANPGFLANGGYEVLDRDGRRVDPESVDWGALTAGRFPYTLVQQPGPANQLGRLKFIFPNDDGICIHDTPARQLFAQPARAMSHGCVRIEDPAGLASKLLSGEGWTPASIGAQITTGRTRTVFLSEPLPVQIVYRTAEVDDAGVVHFHADVYDRDPAVLEALDSPQP